MPVLLLSHVAEVWPAAVTGKPQNRFEIQGWLCCLYVCSCWPVLRHCQHCCCSLIKLLTSWGSCQHQVPVCTPQFDRCRSHFCTAPRQSCSNTPAAEGPWPRQPFSHTAAYADPCLRRKSMCMHALLEAGCKAGTAETCVAVCPTCFVDRVRPLHKQSSRAPLARPHHTRPCHT